MLQRKKPQVAWVDWSNEWKIKYNRNGMVWYGEHMRVKLWRKDSPLKVKFCAEKRALNRCLMHTAQGYNKLLMHMAHGYTKFLWRKQSLKSMGGVADTIGGNIKLKLKTSRWTRHNIQWVITKKEKTNCLNEQRTQYTPSYVRKDQWVKLIKKSLYRKTTN